MFAKIARRIGRRSTSNSQLEITQDTSASTREILVPPLNECHSQRREVVEIAPDLLRWCSLEMPFPSVAFGGYIKYYKTHPLPTMKFIDPPNCTSPLFKITLASSPPPSHTVTPPPRAPTRRSLSLKLPTTTTKTTPEGDPSKKARRTRRYSFSASEKNPPQQFRWRRATCIVTSANVTEHRLSPILSGADSDTNRRLSFDLARSQSSSKSLSSSEDSSSSSFPPDSIEFRHTTPDSESTLPPDSPTSLYSNNNGEADGMMQSIDGSCIDAGTPRRPMSTASYWTAKSAYSQD